MQIQIFLMITCTLIFIQIPAVHVVGNLVWFHPEFMLKHLSKMIDKKLVDQARSFSSHPKEWTRPCQVSDWGLYNFWGVDIDMECSWFIRYAINILFGDNPVPISIPDLNIIENQTHGPIKVHTGGHEKQMIYFAWPCLNSAWHSFLLL